MGPAERHEFVDVEVAAVGDLWEALRSAERHLEAAHALIRGPKTCCSFPEDNQPTIFDRWSEP